MTELFKQNRLIFMSPQGGPEKGAAKSDKVEGPAKGPETALTPEQEKKNKVIALELLVKGLKGKTVVINGKEYSETSEDDGVYKQYLDVLRKGIEDALRIAIQENPEIDETELKEKGLAAMNHSYEQHETERRNLEKAKELISLTPLTGISKDFTVLHIGEFLSFRVPNDVLEEVKDAVINKMAMILGLSDEAREKLYSEGRLTDTGYNLIRQLIDEKLEKSERKFST